MTSRSSKGQGLLIIAMIVVIAALVLAMLYRVFIMTPAYVYQRSIYFVFKYNPQLVVQGLTMDMNTALYSFARNYSQFLLNYGIAIQLPILQGGGFAPLSLIEILSEYYSTITNVVYEPTGLAISTGNGGYSVNLNTGYYGAMSLLNYVYSANNYTEFYVGMNNTYDMPIIGIQNLTLSNTINLTAQIVKPSSSTCLGNIHTTKYLLTTKCIFNFATNSYTCINPAYTITGQTMSLWAPYYNALVSNRISLSNNGLSDSNSKYADPIILLYPIDAVDANYGFKISAVFNPSSASNFLIGINFLAQYPTIKSVSSNNPSNYATGYWVSIYPSGNNYYYAFGGPGVSTTSNSIKRSIWNGNGPVNITIIVNCNGICNPFLNPTAAASIYINNNLIGTISTVYLPQWYIITSSTFGNNAYIMSNGNPIGSWVIIMLQSATVINASIRLTNAYTLPTNVYVAVSMNGQPALGTQLSILAVSQSSQPSILPAQYIVCNITNNAMIYNVTMPQPTGYPLNQYLLLINYSGIMTLINPWSPKSLNYLGLWPLLIANSSATAMAAYLIGLYNPTGNSIYEIPYIANYGIPTLMLFYNGTDITIYNYYDALTPVLPSSITIQPTMDSIFRIYTLKELLIHLPSGYTPLNYTIPQSIINNVGLPIDSAWEFYYSPSQTHESLPITFAPTTILNCQSAKLLNVELFFVKYGNYWGYCSYGSLQYINNACYPQNSAVGGC
ncbi:MAG: hypothetical protein ACP5GY_00090 [Vulcanisaeta sp.]